MVDVKEIDRQSAVAGFSLKNVMWVILIGIFVGIIVWGGALLLERLLIEPIFCETIDGTDICANRQSISYNIALVVGSVAGLLALVKAWIYRPLLISVAVAATMWGMGGIFNGLEWFVGLLLTVMLFVLSYLFYAWIGQIRKLAIVLVVTAIVVVGLRFIPHL